MAICKRFFKAFILIFSLFCIPEALSAQQTESVEAQAGSAAASSAAASSAGTNSAAENSSDEKKSSEASDKKDEFSLNKWDFFFTMGPSILVNTDKDSAPSPIFFSLGCGFEFFNDKIINLQPKVTFFTGYYGWDGECARPQELENRTALVYSVLFDLDGSHTWILEKNALQAGLGISCLARFGALANGVNEDDEGTVAGSTAGNDVNSINSWFFQDLNYLYGNIVFSYMRQLDSKWHAGFESRVYIPVGAIAGGRGMDSTIVSLAVKVCSK